MRYIYKWLFVLAGLSNGALCAQTEQSSYNALSNQIAGDSLSPPELFKIISKLSSLEVNRDSMDWFVP